MKKKDAFIFDHDFYGNCRLKSVEHHRGTVVLPDFSENGEKIIAISPSVFTGSLKIKKIVLSKFLIAILCNNFNKCKNLKQVLFPNEGNLIRIDANAFRDCISLSKVALPEGLLAIDCFSFTNCFSLKEIHLPKSVVTIGFHAFHNCTKLKSVFYAGTKEDWKKIVMEQQDTGSAKFTVYCSDGLLFY